MIHIQSLIDDAKCFETVRALRWPDGVRCPICDSSEITKQGRDDIQSERQRYLCKSCERRVVYLRPAENSAGPVRSRPRDVTRTVMTSHIGFPKPGGRSLVLPIGTPRPLTRTIIMLPCRLPRLELWPWRHAIQQDLPHGPHVIGQPRRHRWRLRLPPLG